MWEGNVFVLTKNFTLVNFRKYFSSFFIKSCHQGNLQKVDKTQNKESRTENAEQRKQNRKRRTEKEAQRESQPKNNLNFV